jgi:DNA-directed RNA polymerase sigma subunit (sigma70/sigma32)
MSVTETTREMVERMVRADPRVSAAAIAEKADVSRERVRQILEDMGYELDCVWRKKNGGSR